MKINYIKQLLFAVTAGCLAVMSTGCTTRLVDFTVISTKNVDWSRAAAYRRTGARTEGKDTAHIIIFIPTGIPNMKEAIDRAIESVPGGVALVDGVVSAHAFYIPYIYGQSSYVVEGTLLVDPALAKNATLDQFMIAHIDKDGNLKDLSGVSQAHYNELKEHAL